MYVTCNQHSSAFARRVMFCHDDTNDMNLFATQPSKKKLNKEALKKDEHLCTHNKQISPKTYFGNAFTTPALSGSSHFPNLVLNSSLNLRPTSAVRCRPDSTLI